MDGVVREPDWERGDNRRATDLYMTNITLWSIVPQHLPVLLRDRPGVRIETDRWSGVNLLLTWSRASKNSLQLEGSE